MKLGIIQSPLLNNQLCFVLAFDQLEIGNLQSVLDLIKACVFFHFVVIMHNLEYRCDGDPHPWISARILTSAIFTCGWNADIENIATFFICYDIYDIPV